MLYLKRMKRIGKNLAGADFLLQSFTICWSLCFISIRMKRIGKNFACVAFFYVLFILLRFYNLLEIEKSRRRRQKSTRSTRSLPRQRQGVLELEIDERLEVGGDELVDDNDRGDDDQHHKPQRHGGEP